MPNFSMTILLYAALGGLFTWAMTALGGSVVFFSGKNKKINVNFLLAISSGVMVAASFFSLLKPAFALVEGTKGLFFFSPFIGFLSGGAFLICCDKFFNLEKIFRVNFKGNSKLKSTFVMIFSIVVHNIPEGLSVGVAFGNYGVVGTEAALASAIMLSLGIGIQNLPEGASVSLPLPELGFSKSKSFFYGQISGIVELFASIFGCLFVFLVSGILPFMLTFAAGAMISVVASEILPSCAVIGKQKVTIGVLLGFFIMMFLDVMLS